MTQDSLPSQILNIFTPLFEELQEIEEGIDFGEFIDASKRLYEVSTKIDRIIFGFRLSTSTPEVCCYIITDNKTGRNKKS